MASDAVTTERFPYPMVAWARDRNGGKLLISAFSALIPTPTTAQAIPQLCLDGWWGIHEWTRFPQPYDSRFPYLSWMRLPPSKNACVLHENITRADVSDRGALKGPKMLELRAEWDWAIQVAEAVFPEVRGQPAYNKIVLPERALERLRHCFFELESGIPAWRDVVDTFRHAQRALLELHGFLDWWTEVQWAPDRSRQMRSRHDAAYLRGCTTTDIEIFRNIAQRHVSVFLVVDEVKTTFELPLNREVEIIARSKFCNTSVWSFDFHTKDLWFYPPIVMSAYDFEEAARGYGSRLDALRPSPDYQRKLTRRRREKQRLENLASKPAKPPHLEIKDFHRLAQRADRPPYSPQTAFVWQTAKLYIDPKRLQKTREIRRYTFPPYTMLWAGNETRQQTSYFHFLALREECSARLARGQGPLTFQEWKEILGDSYWKKRWPKIETGVMYDPREFWKYGGCQVFGHQTNEGEVKGAESVLQQLDCGCPLTASTGDDYTLRNQVLFKLNLENIRDELDQMAALQAKLLKFSDERIQKLKRTVEEYFEEVECGGYSSSNWKERQDWASRLQKMVVMWHGYDAEVRAKTANADRDIYALSENQYCDLERFLLVFYWHSFMHHLCIIPTELLKVGGPTEHFRCEQHRCLLD